jgi:hypothetical protein
MQINNNFRKLSRVSKNLSSLVVIISVLKIQNKKRTNIKLTMNSKLDLISD